MVCLSQPPFSVYLLGDLERTGSEWDLGCQLSSAQMQNMPKPCSLLSKTNTSIHRMDRVCSGYSLPGAPPKEDLDFLGWLLHECVEQIRSPHSSPALRTTIVTWLRPCLHVAVVCLRRINQECITGCRLSLGPKESKGADSPNVHLLQI